MGGLIVDTRRDERAVMSRQNFDLNEHGTGPLQNELPAAVRRTGARPRELAGMDLNGERRHKSPGLSYREVLEEKCLPHWILEQRAPPTTERRHCNSK